MKKYIESIKIKQKKVIFLDELPWMAKPKSNFITAFEGFWIGWASARKDLVVIICGSASSWMIQKIEKSKGGLYNRITKRIVLKSFTLSETDTFFRSKDIVLRRNHITEMYMSLGGVPHYLNQIRKGETPAIAVDRLIFNKDGLLSDEYEQLFVSLFGENGHHKQIIHLLSGYRYGLSREELLLKLGIKSSGWFSNIIAELEASAFIEIQVPFSKNTKDALIKVTDNFSLFIESFKKDKSISNWALAHNSEKWRS